MVHAERQEFPGDVSAIQDRHVALEVGGWLSPDQVGAAHDPAARPTILPFLEAERHPRVVKGVPNYNNISNKYNNRFRMKWSFQAYTQYGL